MDILKTYNIKRCEQTNQWELRDPVGNLIKSDSKCKYLVTYFLEMYKDTGKLVRVEHQNKSGKDTKRFTPYPPQRQNKKRVARITLVPTDEDGKIINRSLMWADAWSLLERFQFAAKKKEKHLLEAYGVFARYAMDKGFSPKDVKKTQLLSDAYGKPVLLITVKVKSHGPY